MGLWLGLLQLYFWMKMEQKPKWATLKLDYSLTPEKEKYSKLIYQKIALLSRSEKLHRFTREGAWLPLLIKLKDRKNLEESRGQLLLSLWNRTGIFMLNLLREETCKMFMLTLLADYRREYLTWAKGGMKRFPILASFLKSLLEDIIEKK